MARKTKAPTNKITTSQLVKNGLAQKPSTFGSGQGKMKWRIKIIHSPFTEYGDGLK